MDQTINIAAVPADSVAPRAGFLTFDASVLTRYLRALQRRKWHVAGIIVVCFAVALLATLLATPLYSATSRIEISRSQENVTNVETLQSEEAGKTLEFYQTQYSLLETRSLAERVARSLNLANDGTFLSVYGLESEDGSEGGAEVGPEAHQRQIADILLDNIEIDPVRGSALVDISYVSPSPSLSAKVANAWTAQFIASNLDRRFASTADARDFLEEQLASLRERLEQSERDLVNSAANTRIIELSTSEDASGGTRTDRTLVSADLEALNASLAEAISARIEAESKARGPQGVSDIALGSSVINGLRQQRALLQGEYAKMLEQFQPGYPAAQALAAQIDSLDSAITREEARVNSGSATGYRQAVARESQLRSQVENLKDQLIAQRRDSIQYAIFQREVDTNRQLYDALLQRYKEIGVAGVGSNNVAVVDRAQAPRGPSSPSLLLNLLLGLLAGLLISAAMIVLLENLDQSLKDPHEVDRLLGLPLLGAIPRDEKGEIREAVDDPKSAASEAYLSVKANLSFLTDHGVPRSFMLTSTAPNEGKSISSLALAQTLARSGKRVVLVDGDLRNPSVGGLLDLQVKEGLTNYLAGDDNIGALLTSTSHPNLTYLAAGPMPPNAAELLASGRLGRLVADLSKQFDHVVIDSPPILGLADAPLLSGAVEGAILVIEANKLRLRAIESSLKRLRSANAHMLGAIVTKLDERNSAYGYGSGEARSTSEAA